MIAQIAITVILLLLLGGCIASLVAASNTRNWDAKEGFQIIAFVSGFVLVVLAAISIITYISQVSAIERLTEFEARIDNAEERQSEVESVLLRELTQYPEFERDAYEAFVENSDPDILLRFPELRSNAVVIASAENYVKAIDTVYSEKQDLEEVRRNIRSREANIFAPKLPGFPFQEDR